MSAPITALYAAPIAAIFMILSARVILYRRGNQISLGDRGDTQLLQRMRAQSNCAEYAPMGLVLLLLAELGGGPALMLHLMGGLLLAGRAIHGWGFSKSHLNLNSRVIGMALTLTSLGLGVVLCLWIALS